MIGKLQCLYIYIFLYGGVIIVIFMRAFFRRKLMNDYIRINMGKESSIYSGNLNPFSILLKQRKVLRWFNKRILDLPDAVQSRYRRFRMLTTITLIFLFFLLVFSFVAHNMCGK